MTNFEKMTNAIDLAKDSNVPFLFVGNPGEGKTTIVKLWAEKNGYHLEEIMGASFDRSEVLGYMVNVDGRLEMLEPFWFRRIRELAEQGKKSVLFIDELSTTGSDVQSSLLRLIFERTIGNGDTLPEGTIVISAANFKGNLPGYCDISSPTLNRFCMINVQSDSLEDLVDEYVINEIPTPKTVKFGTIKRPTEARKLIGETLKKVFIKYSVSDDSGSIPSLNPLNHNLQIYDLENDTNTKKLCNFISGRCISHLSKVIMSIAKSDIEEVKPLVQAAVEGLIGAGTNNFQSETIQDAYIAFATDNLTKNVEAIRQYVSYNAPAYEETTIKMVEELKKPVAKSSSSNDELFENIRRNVEFNPEEKDQIVTDMEALAAAIKIRGRNFTKKYNNDKFFASVCLYITDIYADYIKKSKLDKELVNYVKYYVRRADKKNNAVAA